MVTVEEMILWWPIFDDADDCPFDIIDLLIPVFWYIPYSIPISDIGVADEEEMIELESEEAYSEKSLKYWPILGEFYWLEHSWWLNISWL